MSEKPTMAMTAAVQEVRDYVFDLGWNAAVDQITRIIMIEVEFRPEGLTPKQARRLLMSARMCRRDPRQVNCAKSADDEHEAP